MHEESSSSSCLQKSLSNETISSTEESDDLYEPPEKKVKKNIPFDVEIKILNLVREHPKWTLKTIHRNGDKSLKLMRDLKTWKAEIKKGGSAMEKFHIINKDF